MYICINGYYQILTSGRDRSVNTSLIKVQLLLDVKPRRLVNFNPLAPKFSLKF